MPAPSPKRENLLVNLICNVALPTLVLTKFSGENTLGPNLGLIVALLFPVSYGVQDFIRRRRVNFISAIGFASVLISGGLGLMHLDGFWFAVKEAAIPSIHWYGRWCSRPRRFRPTACLLGRPP